jgi:hypothetical protein
MRSRVPALVFTSITKPLAGAKTGIPVVVKLKSNPEPSVLEVEYPVKDIGVVE